MSESPWNDPLEADGTRDPAGEELLELLLAAGRGDPAAAQRLARREARSASEAARIDDLRLFLAQLGEWARYGEQAAPAPTQRALERRVLARTTREDLSRWGDLGLALRFVGARLRASGALRLAAASLLLHLLALPVVAWMVWSSPPAPARIWFEPPALPSEPPYGEGQPEPELSPQAPAVDDAAVLEALAKDREREQLVQDSLRWARWVLGQRSAPALPARAAGEGELAGLVRLRAERLAEGRAADPGTAGPGPGADGVVRALWAELLLDALVLGAEPPAALESALLALLPEPDGTPADPLARAAARLEAAALARAEAYGVLPPGLEARLAAARGTLAGEGGPGPRGAEAWLVAPFDPGWTALLLRAAGARLGPEWRAALLGAR